MSVCVDKQNHRELSSVTKSSPPAAKCRLGHRRNVSDTSASSISLPGHQSAFRSVLPSFNIVHRFLVIIYVRFCSPSHCMQII